MIDKGKIRLPARGDGFYIGGRLAYDIVSALDHDEGEGWVTVRRWVRRSEGIRAQVPSEPVPFGPKGRSIGSSAVWSDTLDSDPPEPDMIGKASGVIAEEIEDRHAEWQWSNVGSEHAWREVLLDATRTGALPFHEVRSGPVRAAPELSREGFEFGFVHVDDLVVWLTSLGYSVEVGDPVVDARRQDAGPGDSPFDGVVVEQRVAPAAFPGPIATGRVQHAANRSRSGGSLPDVIEEAIERAGGLSAPNRRIWMALMAMADADDPPEPLRGRVSVAERVAHDKEPKRSGGIKYLAVSGKLEILNYASFGDRLRRLRLKADGTR